MPFSWDGVELYATGASVVRVKLTPVGHDAVAVLVADGTGETVAVVDSLTLRPARLDGVDVDAQRSVQRDSLYRLDWTPRPAAVGRSTAAASYLFLDAEGSESAAEALRSRGHQVSVHADLASLADALRSTGSAPQAVIVPVYATTHTAGSDDAAILSAAHTIAADTLRLLQDWLRDETLCASRLVVLTRNAIAARPHDTVGDLSASVTWGLLRSAQSEQPDRFTLVDIDDSGPSWDAMAATIASGQPQTALREGEALLPRLARRPAQVPGPEDATVWEPSGTLLIVGGTGVLGGLVARHLATAHGVRHLVLIGRRGLATPGVDVLVEELSIQDVAVSVVACDAADRAQLASVIANIDPAHPLRGVVHAAGVLDDAVLDAVTPAQLSHSLGRRPTSRGICTN